MVHGRAHINPSPAFRPREPNSMQFLEVSRRARYSKPGCLGGAKRGKRDARSRGEKRKRKDATVRCPTGFFSSGKVKLFVSYWM